MLELGKMTAVGASQGLERHEFSAEDLARACLARIASREPDLHAWAYLDPDAVIRAARELDKSPRRSKLHGVPVAIKDMIDTGDMPTQHNSPAYVGHRPAEDAGCVRILRAAGALIIGKTETLEFAAAGRWAAARNPHDPAHSPGGSSSGSAVVVADAQVPLALGTQTGGSLIRPASFCGVHAFKPSWGLISREGMRIYAVTLDTVGWYGRSAADLSFLFDIFARAGDVAMPTGPVAGMRIACCRSPIWGSAEEETQAALADAADRLAAAGATVEELTLPAEFDGLNAAHRRIQHAEGAASFQPLSRHAPDLLPAELQAQVDNKEGATRAQILAAYDDAAACRPRFDAIAAAYDAILTPSAPGVAPEGRRPGDPVFNRMWTLLHVPCVGIPSYTAPGGLPVGVTLVAGRWQDRALLACAEAISAVLVPAA